MHLNRNYNNREGNSIMGYKVDMSEVHNMQKSIDSSYAEAAHENDVTWFVPQSHGSA